MPIASLQSVKGQHISPFQERGLNIIAEAEADSWSEIARKFKCTHKVSARKFLNDIKTKIETANDPTLNRLFSRAVLNLNAFKTSIDKSDLDETGKKRKYALPASVYRHQYSPPPFLIPEAKVHLDVKTNNVFVETNLQIHRNSNQASLILDCKDQKVLSVSINGVPLEKKHYRATLREIILLNVPANQCFTVQTVCEIDPLTNGSGTGMYKSGKHLTTHCKPEEASRIFPTLDRPDVLTKIKTQITADSNLYPLMISNGDLISEKAIDQNRKTSLYEDPVPKPCYLFAVVLGNLEGIEDNFVTKNGLNVKLKVLVQPGQSKRGEFALKALKEAMKLDEDKFGRVYGHNSLTCVAMDQCNSGATENTTLMIFNSLKLLVDKDTGTDQQYRDVFHEICHGISHYWRGGRIPIRDFFGIVLNKAFADWCCGLMVEETFGEEYSRIKEVMDLQAKAFPLMNSKTGHPLKINSYLDTHCIYDSMTYIYGREVFRALDRYIDLCLKGGSKQALDDYFRINKGKPVCFEDLLKSGNRVLKPIGKDLKQFERWFTQQGVPTVRVSYDHDKENKKFTLTLIQSNIHPVTHKPQEALAIPFSYELIGKDGSVLHQRTNIILENEKHTFEIEVDSEDAIPVLMHGYSAPLTLDCPYTFQQLESIALFSTDVYCRWKAGQDYSIKAIKEIMEGKNPSDLVHFYKKALESDSLSHIAKSQLLNLPSLVILAQKLNDYDFEVLNTARERLLKEIVSKCESNLKDLYSNLPIPEVFEPTQEQMGVRELRNRCLHLLLSYYPEEFAEKAWNQYQKNREDSPSSNFNDAYAAFTEIVRKNTKENTGKALECFYSDWHKDKTVFNHWIAAKASGRFYVEDVEEITSSVDKEGEQIWGFDERNTNHLRSLYSTFIENSLYFHRPDGKGYRFIIDAILKIGQFNPTLSHNYLFLEAIADFFNLPPSQQAIFAKELRRMLCNYPLSQTRDAASKLLEWYEQQKPTITSPDRDDKSLIPVG